jgi:ribosomal protein S21
MNACVKVDPDRPIAFALALLKKQLSRSGMFREIKRRAAFPALGQRRRAKHRSAVKAERRRKMRTQRRQAQYDD